MHAISSCRHHRLAVGGRFLKRVAPIGAAIAAVEYAMELAGGAGFYRSAGLERRFRDIQAVRYHPLQAGPQAEYTGSMVLGLPVDRIF